VSRDSGLFRPFEVGKKKEAGPFNIDAIAKKMLSLSQFNIVAADLGDKKS